MTIRDTDRRGSAISDETHQDSYLLQVSRTFALTIPQLPPPLRTAVTNAYLLCRIADTIEDEPTLSPADKQMFLQRFKTVMSGGAKPGPLAGELGQRLSERTLQAERELVADMERVIAVTSRLDAQQRAAIQRCVELMCYGMPQFQSTASLRGLPDLNSLDDYCYYVAGVVGEMLTELMCGYSPEIARQRQGLQEFATSFAQGLQMTNILKDVWEDRSRGACWLPQEVFTRYGFDLAQLSPGHYDARFGAGLQDLIGVVHAHLRNALAFTLLIPGREAGIRRFCLWSIGLAILTLRKIARDPRYTAGAQVKVSRRTVAMTCTLTSLFVGSDRMLIRFFEMAARGLPLAPSSEVRRARPAPAAGGIKSEPRAEYGTHYRCADVGYSTENPATATLMERSAK